MVNSRLGLFSATTLCSIRMGLHNSGYPLSRSYGYILPSSLTRVLPRTLGFSPRIPVSVYGTGGSSLTRSFFSTVWGQQLRSHLCSLRITPQAFSAHGFAYAPPYTLTHALPFACLPALLCHSIAQTITTGTGISTSCPSPTLSASDWVPTYPETTIVAQESLCFRWKGFSPFFSLLIPTFSLPTSPPNLPVRLLPYGNAPLPRILYVYSHSFGFVL